MKNKLSFDFYAPLLVGKKIRKPEKKIMKIRTGKSIKNLYLIISAKGNDLFDIISYKELKKPFYHEQHLFVIGIASDYDEAVELVQDFLLEYYNKHGDLAFKDEINKFNGVK